MGSHVRILEYLTKLWFDEQTTSGWRTIFYSTSQIGDDFNRHNVCGYRFPAAFIVSGATDFSILSSFCINGNRDYYDTFRPSTSPVWSGGAEAFTSGTWHRMEYKQVAIPGSSNAQFSVTINDIEIWTQEIFKAINFVIGSRVILKGQLSVIFNSKL